MTRLLFLGDLARTGFGTVTMDLGQALLDLGIDVRFCSLSETPGELPEPFASRTALLGSPGGWLDETNPETVGRLEGMFLGSLFEDGWTPDIGLVTGDIGSLKISPVLQFIPEGFPVLHYVPIEGIGLPPSWAAVWRKVQPVAMSQFGADEIAKVTGHRPPVVYHGVDPLFHPASVESPIRIDGKRLRAREACRRFFGGDPDDIWLLRTDRHMPRKAYGSLLRSIAPVLRGHPNVKLILHCRTMDGGGDMRDEISKYGVLSRQIVMTGFMDPPLGGLQREALAALYNAADIYVSVSAEGFGLTIAEALACGVPAVGMDYSSVPEVIGPAGVLVPIAGLIDNIYSYFWARVDEPKFGQAVEGLIRDVAKRRLLGAQGPRHVAAHFSWPNAARQFVSLIELRNEVAA
jgi:glycosyltransferase involved in cell wall biosynthesis